MDKISMNELQTIETKVNLHSSELKRIDEKCEKIHRQALDNMSRLDEHITETKKQNHHKRINLVEADLETIKIDIRELKEAVNGSPGNSDDSGIKGEIKLILWIVDDIKKFIKYFKWALATIVIGIVLFLIKAISVL